MCLYDSKKYSYSIAKNAETTFQIQWDSKGGVTVHFKHLQNTQVQLREFALICEMCNRSKLEKITYLTYQH